MPLAHKHKLVALGIDAHGEMRRFAGRIRRRFFEKLTAARRHLARALNDVCHLEAESRPCPLTVTPAVDANDRPCDLDFAHHIALTKDLRLQRAAIKFHSPLHVCRPDDVFCMLDVHGTKQYASNLSDSKINP